jgi:hypothetical protein
MFLEERRMGRVAGGRLSETEMSSKKNNVTKMQNSWLNLSVKEMSKNILVSLTGEIPWLN